jgi:hypothetical protein
MLGFMNVKISLTSLLFVILGVCVCVCLCVCVCVCVCVYFRGFLLYLFCASCIIGHYDVKLAR